MICVAWPNETPGAVFNEIVAGKLALVIDREWRIRRLKMRDGAEWHLISRSRLDVNLVQRTWFELEFRIDLEHDVILVLLRVNDRDLSLAERAVKGVIDRLRLNAEARCRVAIDHDVLLQAAKLLVAGRILDLGIALQFPHEFGCP